MISTQVDGRELFPHEVEAVVDGLEDWAADFGENFDEGPPESSDLLEKARDLLACGGVWIIPRRAPRRNRPPHTH